MFETIDAAVDSFVKDVEAKQTDYYAEKLRYFQVVSFAPASDAGSDTDVSLQLPTDQAETIGDFKLTPPDKLPCGVSITVYDGPNGKGYDVVQRVNDAGRSYVKTTSHGPENHRTHDWREVKIPWL